MLVIDTAMAIAPMRSTGLYTAGRTSSSGVISSTDNDHRILYLLVDKPRPPKANETFETFGSQLVCHVEKLESHVWLMSI